MINKDPQSFIASPWFTYLWMLLLSVWGGVANYIRKVRDGDSEGWSIVELFGEMVIAGFAGIITFLLCGSQEINPLLTAAFVGIAGHMGSRAIYLAERWLKRRYC